MELEHSFTIPVPPEQAWEALLDVERVAPCMPGATVDSVEDEVITGRIKVKVGPVTLTYAGKAHFRERDERTRSVTLEASGRETRGAGTATATVRSLLRGEGDQTEVIVHTSLAVTGRPAQFGRGMLTEVGGRIIDKFATNLAAQLAAGPAAGTTASNGAGPEAAAPGPAPTPGAGAATEPGQAASGRDSAEETQRAGAGPGTAHRQGPAAGAARAPIDDLNLPARATASLRLAGITTAGDLAACDEKALLALAGIGPQTVRQIRGKLAGLGLELAGPGAGGPGEAPAPARPGPEPGPAITPPDRATPVGGPAPAPAVTPPAGHAALPGQPARPAPSPQPAPPPRPPARPLDEEAIDLLNVAGLPVLKRILPAAGLLTAVVALFVMLLRRRRGSPGSAPRRHRA